MNQKDCLLLSMPIYFFGTLSEFKIESFKSKKPCCSQHVKNTNYWNYLSCSNTDVAEIYKCNPGKN